MKKLTSVIKSVFALFLATVLLTQILTLVQSGGTGDNMALADHGLNPMPNWIDPTTCELSKDVREAYKAGYTLGKSSKVYPPPPVPPEFSDTPQEGLDFNGGYLDGLHCVPSTSKGTQPQQQVDQTCPVGTQPENTPVTSRSTSQNNIKPASYIPGGQKSYQNPEIINVQGSGGPSTKAPKVVGPFTYDKKPWKFTYEVVDKEGLVIKDMKAGNQIVFKELSVPHFKIETFRDSPTIVRFSKDCIRDYTDLKQAEKLDNDRDVINWQFKREIKEEGLQGILTIDYKIVIWTTINNDCEKGAGFNCYRFVPMVSYSWTGVPAELGRFTAFYRLDYDIRDGFALTKDEDSFGPFLTNNLYRQDIRTQEIRFDAVIDGRAGEYDNIHTVHENEQVIIPGCGRSSWFFLSAAFKVKTQYNAFDCVHIHWRWSESDSVDPMKEPSDYSKSIHIPEDQRGKPNLVPGQTIQIGIVREDTLPQGTPKDPDQPLANKYMNGERIATTYEESSIPYLRPEKTLKSLKERVKDIDKDIDTVVWYVASSKQKAKQDIFFRHGIFVIDPKTKNAELETVRSNLQGLKMDGGEGVKSGILAQMDTALGNDNWLADGNSLADQKGEIVFTSLSQVAGSLAEARNRTPEIVDPVLSDVLSAAQDVVNTNLQIRIANTVASSPGSEAEFDKLFAENQAIKQAIEKYVSSSSESDISRAALIVDGFKQSWLDGVKGISEIATALGISPPIISTGNATGTTVSGTPSGTGGGGGTTDNDFLNYDNSEYGFKIKYPTSWTKNEIPEGVNFVSASEVFNVWSFKNIGLFENEKKTLDENVKAIIDERMRTQSNFQLEESNDIDFNALPAHKMLFTYTDSVTGPTRVMEVVVINGNVRYELYFAASTEVFAKSLPTAEQMFDSFELVGTGDNTKIDAGDETIIDTDPADPAASSSGQQSPSQAVLISDNFDSENNGKGELQYRTFMNWIPKEGTVDLIGNGFYDIPGGKGLYVDLDGANLDAGILESKEEFSLSPGNYVLEFDISGPYFQGDANDVKVQLGNAFTETFTKEGAAPFEHIVRTIVVSQPTTAKLSFDHSGGDNIGLKLDNVKLYKSSSSVDTPKINADDETIVDTDPDEPPAPSPAKADMIDYENPDFRLAMKYQSNWAVQENPDYVVFTSPAENEADTSVESLYVYHLGDIPLGQSEEDTLKSNVDATIDYREPYSDFQLLSSNNIEFNGNTAGQIEYTYTDTNIGNTKAKEIIAIDGNDRYDILFIANADQYSSTLPAAQEIIDSIEITPSQQYDEPGPTTSDQGINTANDDGNDGTSGDDGTKIDAGGETIVDTFDDPAVTDGEEGGEGVQGGEGGDNPQNGVDDNTSLSPSDFKDYSNSGLQLSMKYPSDWTVQENPDEITFASPLSGESDQYVESLAIYFAGNLQLFETEQETLEKNVETVTEHRKATLTGFEIQDSQDITVLGLPAHKLVYTMDDVNIGPAKATEIILVNGNNRYDLLFIANIDQYDSVLPVAEEMINSILLTPEDRS